MTGAEDHTQIMDKLDKLERELMGVEGSEDTHPGVLGIVRKQGRHMQLMDERLTMAERTLDRYRWTVAGFSAAGAVFGGVMVALIGRIG